MSSVTLKYIGICLQMRGFNTCKALRTTTEIVILETAAGEEPDSPDQSAWSLREHVIGDAESVYGINPLPHKTVLECLKEDSQVFSHLRPRTHHRARRECLWYQSGLTQNGVFIPPRGWKGHLVPPSSNASSGTPRVLMSPMSPIDPKGLGSEPKVYRKGPITSMLDCELLDNGQFYLN
ncbi:hypothetical protein C8R44DRAFT_741184 [Mycena epipterygia]|nr:hypothetical protein C8R44DRAFT_741184 [Mycena epipterygia]